MEGKLAELESAQHKLQEAQEGGAQLTAEALALLNATVTGLVREIGDISKKVAPMWLDWG